MTVLELENTIYRLQLTVSCLIIRNFLLYIIFQINNPDKRVVIIKEFALANFPSNDVLNFALDVEKVTTAKVHCDCYKMSKPL